MPSSQLLQPEGKVSKNATKKHKQSVAMNSLAHKDKGRPAHNFRNMLEICFKSNSSNLLCIEDVLEVKLYELALMERDAWPELFAGHGEALQVVDDVQQPAQIGGVAIPPAAENDGLLHSVSVRTNIPVLDTLTRHEGGLGRVPIEIVLPQVLSALMERCRLYRAMRLTEGESTHMPELIMEGRLSADCQRCNFDANASGPDGLMRKLEHIVSHNQRPKDDALHHVDLLLRNSVR